MEFIASLEQKEVTLPGTVAVTIQNHSLTAVDFDVTARAPKNLIRFQGQRGHIRLQPGQTTAIRLSLEARQQRPLISQEFIPFEVLVQASNGQRHSLINTARSATPSSNHLKYALILILLSIMACGAIDFWFNLSGSLISATIPGSTASPGVLAGAEIAGNTTSPITIPSPTLAIALPAVSPTHSQTPTFVLPTTPVPTPPNPLPTNTPLPPPTDIVLPTDTPTNVPPSDPDLVILSLRITEPNWKITGGFEANAEVVVKNEGGQPVSGFEVAIAGVNRENRYVRFGYSYDTALTSGLPAGESVTLTGVTGLSWHGHFDVHCTAEQFDASICAMRDEHTLWLMAIVDYCEGIEASSPCAVSESNEANNTNGPFIIMKPE